MLVVPKSRHWELAMNSPFRFAFIVDEIESDNALKEDMELGVRLRVTSNFEERSEDVCERISVEKSESQSSGQNPILRELAFRYSLLMTSSKLSTVPLALYTS